MKFTSEPLSGDHSPIFKMIFADVHSVLTPTIQYYSHQIHLTVLIALGLDLQLSPVIRPVTLNTFVLDFYLEPRR